MVTTGIYDGGSLGLVFAMGALLSTSVGVLLRVLHWHRRFDVLREARDNSEPWLGAALGFWLLLLLLPFFA